nr:MAG TPA: hypothetical protein [Bacteriophage sp.]
MRVIIFPRVRNILYRMKMYAELIRNYKKLR